MSQENFDIHEPATCTCVLCKQVYTDNQSAFCPHPTNQPRGGHPRFYELVNEISDLHDRKNRDYRGVSGPVSNFERLSAIMRLYPGMDWDSPYGTAVFQALKQIDAALALRVSKKESAVGEPIPSRMRDVAVLSLLSIVLIEEEKQRGKN